MKRLISLLAVAACLLGASPAMADDAVADGAGLPDHIVNGDFEYHSDIIGGWGWESVIPATGKRYSTGWEFGPSDWDESKFGWHSTQTDDEYPNDELKADAVEIQSFGRSNTWAEIVAAQVNTSIYQDIRVMPGNTYHWSLKHQSIVRANTMQVLIGEPGKETPQRATRTKTNGGGDQLGPVGTDITTNNKLPYQDNNPDNRGAPENWETYEGDWTCPEDVTVARFTFKDIDSATWNTGNLVDDIGFNQSTTLRYDPNGGTGAIADQTVGINTPAYTATDGYTFASHGLASWNTKPDGTGDAYKPGETIAIDKPTTLYAQWADVTQTTMPETGGTMTPRTPTTILGGGLAFWPSFQSCWQDDACAGKPVREGGVTC